MKYIIVLLIIYYNFLLLLKKFLRVFFIFLYSNRFLHFMPSFDFAIFLIFFSPFFFIYTFFYFSKFFLFPFYKFLKNFFVLIFYRFFSFFYVRCIDFLFSFFIFLYKFHGSFFFGTSYQDPIVKTFIFNSSLKKSEFLKDFYLFSSSYLQNPEVITQTSIFSSFLIFDKLKKKDVLQAQFLNFKQLLEYNQIIRSTFFFSTRKNSKFISMRTNVSNLFVFQRLKFLLSLYYTLLNFFRTFSLSFDTSLYVCLYKTELSLRGFSQPFSVFLLFVLKYFELLRRSSRFLVFDFYNDSFVNYYYYLIRRYELAFGLDKDSLKFRINSFFNTSVLFPDVFSRGGIFSLIFFFRFCSTFLFVFINFLIFSIFFTFLKLVRRFFFLGHFLTFLSKNFNNFSFFLFLRAAFLTFNFNFLNFFSTKTVRVFRFSFSTIFYRITSYFFFRKLMILKFISFIFSLKTFTFFVRFVRILLLFVFIYLQKFVYLYIFPFFPLSFVTLSTTRRIPYQLLLNLFLKLTLDFKRQEFLKFSVFFFSLDKSVFTDHIKKKIFELFSNYLSSVAIYYPTILFRRSIVLFFLISRFQIYPSSFVFFFFPFFYLFKFFFLFSSFFSKKESFFFNILFFTFNIMFYLIELIFFKFFSFLLFSFDFFFSIIKNLSHFLIFQFNFCFFYLHFLFLRFYSFSHRLYFQLNLNNSLSVFFFLIKIFYISWINVYFFMVIFFLIIFFFILKLIFIFLFIVLLVLFLFFYYIYVFFFILLQNLQRI